MEQTLVVGIVGALMYFGLPAAKQLFNTLETPSGTKALIGSALASARAIAAREQNYVGIRFQHACYRDPQGDIQPEKSPLKTPQYMIFIKHNPMQSNDQDTFTVIEGIEPIKLPENIGVMDLILTPSENQLEPINTNGEIDNDVELLDTTTFSIVFTPAGRLVMLEVLARNRDGATLDTSEDDIINTEDNVRKGIAMFIQDNDPVANHILEQEPSRRNFIIYDRSIFRSLPEGQRYEKYLKDLRDRKMIYINPYTGTFINR